MEVVAVGLLLLHWLLHLFTAVHADSTKTTAKFVKQCVNEHNWYRSAVSPGAANMRFVSWDAGLAKTAKAWSKTCKFKNNPCLKVKGKGHPYFDKIGENLYVSSDTFSVVEAIKEWNAEGSNFHYANNTCLKNKTCDNFIQLIWGDTYKIGCGAHQCPNHIEGSEIKKGIIFVCNYVPSGNRKGEKPYIKGKSCTSCGAEFCRDKLCSDPDREKISQYPNWKPDFGSASILLSKCQLLLMSISLIYILYFPCNFHVFY